MKDRFIRASGNKKSPYFGWPSNSKLQMESCRVAYRWVTNRTNTRTTVACLVPPGAAVNSAPVFVFPEGNERQEAFLLGVMSSIIFDWQSRLIVEGNLTFELLGQLACPWNHLESTLGKRLVSLSATLASPDQRFSEWANALGVSTGEFKLPSQRDDAIAECDALVALMFELDSQQVSHVFETFHRGWDYKPRLEKVLEYYDHWKDKA
jgi:hypothetical protein